MISRDFSKRNLDAQNYYVYVICCHDNKTEKFKFSSKGLNKRVLEDSGDGPMSKYRRVLDEAINVTSTNRGFIIINHMVVTYEQTIRGLTYFFPKR